MSNNPSFAPAPVPGSPTPQANKDRFATISLILGIVAIVFCCIRLIPIAFVNYCITCLTFLMSIAGIVLGIMGIKSSKKVLAIVGIVLCVLALVIPIVTILISLIFNLNFGGLDVLNNVVSRYRRRLP